MAKPKDFARLDIETGLENPASRLFVDPSQMGFIDLSGVRLLRCGVDTVRQLYRGMIRPEIMALFEKPGTLVDFAGQRWHSGRVGKDSGYQYKLQNADLGIITVSEKLQRQARQHRPSPENRSVTPCNRHPVT